MFKEPISSAETAAWGQKREAEADCTVASLIPAFRSGYKHGISSTAWVERTLNVIYSGP